MGQTDDEWPPARWRWPPAAHHVPAMCLDVSRIARLYASWRRLTRDDAEEVAQSTIATLYGSGEGVHHESYMGFRHECVRHASNALRRIARQKGRELPIAFDPAAVTQDSADAADEGVIAALPDEQMRAVVRAKAAGLTHPQVAQSLGIPLNRVANLLRQARLRLQARGYGPQTEEAS